MEHDPGLLLRSLLQYPMSVTVSDADSFSTVVEENVRMRKKFVAACSDALPIVFRLSEKICRKVSDSFCRYAYILCWDFHETNDTNIIDQAKRFIQLCLFLDNSRKLQ